jgi:hypothetical protein
MNKVLNLILSFVVFFVGWKLFPETFQFSGAGAVVIVSLIRYIVGTLLGFALILGFLATTLSGSVKGFVTMIVLMFASVFMFNIIYILIASKVYSGFTFNGGVGTLILTSIALSLFSVDVKTNKESNN